MKDSILMVHSKTIYVIKENDVNKDLLIRILQHNGFKIKYYKDAFEFINKIADNSKESTIHEKNPTVIWDNIPEHQRDFFNQLLFSFKWIIDILNKFNIGFAVLHKNKYILVNGPFIQITGLKTEELISYEAGDLVHIKDRKNIKLHLRKCTKNKLKDLSVQASFTSLDRKIRDFNAITLPHRIGKNTYVSAYLFFDAFHDLNNRKEITYLKFLSYEMNNILSNLIKMNHFDVVKHQPKEKILNNANEKNIFQSHFLITEREFEVLRLLYKGLTSNQIAKKLCISNRTVETHRYNILEKTQTKNTIELIRLVYKYNLFMD